MTRGYQIVNLLLCIIVISCEQEQSEKNTWSAYGGSGANDHYSTLSQINTTNVDQLTVAWEYHTGDSDTINHSQIQCNPIIIDETLYGTSPKLKLFALDAATGKEKWVFNPFDSLKEDKSSFFNLNNCRGVTYWSDGDLAKRIFYTAGSQLYAIDAQKGIPIPEFGNDGSIDLHDDLGREVSDLLVISTSPGRIYKDLIIIGTRVDEGAAAAPGHIRAYHVKTGKLAWIFHTIPHPGEYGFETWDDSTAYQFIGGANAWSGFSIDEKRAIVYAATGSSSFDFYGGKRTGDNLFANCLLALDAATGERIWHFQYVHHDVWDRDYPCPPALVTITRNGKKIEAVAQTTKTGHIYVFDRVTGDPLFPIKEQPVPTQTTIKGEKLSPTQPIPSMPKPIVRQVMKESDLNPLIPDSSYQIIKAKYDSYQKGHLYMPPSKEGTIILPGFDGGAEWGGPAFDVETGNLIVNANEMAWVLTMVELEKDIPLKETVGAAGKRLYNHNCRICHGPTLEGSGNNPTLVGISKKYDAEEFQQLVISGRRMMPGFKHLSSQKIDAIAAFVLDQKEQLDAPYKENEPNWNDPYDLPYSITGYNKFLTPEGYPAISPPWGTISAVNLNSGELVWSHTLGQHLDFEGTDFQTGTENYGGPIVTSGGLIFIAATSDGKFRAFNKFNGELLWEYDLPAAGFATPAVYQENGRQFIVIACGGGKLKTKSGDSYIAFALPN